jgi:translation initiation factor 3 subunit I
MSKKGKEHSTVKQFSLNGHTRPVRMVRYNRDGDMFFTCSDDNLIVAWDNETAQKLGVYERKSACKSMAVSRNTEYVVGSYALEGINIFHAIDGDHLVHGITGDGSKAQYVEFSYGDDELLVLTTNKDGSRVNIYDFKKLLKNGKDKGDISKALLRAFSFSAEISQASFGYLNKGIYLSDNKGKMLIINAITGEIEVDAKVHPGFEIFSFAFSVDFSMLASCGKDNMCKLLNPDTLEIIKIFDKESP